MNDKVEKRKRMTHDYSIITIHLFLSSYIALMLNSYFRFLNISFIIHNWGIYTKELKWKKKKKINKFLMMRTEKESWHNVKLKRCASCTVHVPSYWYAIITSELSSLMGISSVWVIWIFFLLTGTVMIIFIPLSFTLEFLM